MKPYVEAEKIERELEALLVAEPVTGETYIAWTEFIRTVQTTLTLLGQHVKRVAAGEAPE